MKKNLAMGLAVAAAVAASGTLAQAQQAAPAAAPAAPAAPADIRILVAHCFNCHGTNGASVGIVDELDQLSAKRMVSKMAEFKADKKASTIMNRIAKGYTEAEVEAIAQYFEKANAGKAGK
ncbi:MAG: hypothetical protein H7841_06220 [Magnetospirillum sp. WYHS-4]